MESQLRPSVATEAAKRSKLVALSDWFTKDGEPLRVLCGEVDAVECARITNTLPGERPQLGIPDDADPATQPEQAKRILMISADVIELGTSLLAPDGSEVRPAFFFGEGGRRHELSLDGSKLSELDLMRLSVEVLRCSGCLGGAAEAMFLRSKRDGAGPGRRALEVLPVDRAEPSAGNA